MKHSNPDICSITTILIASGTPQEYRNIIQDLKPYGYQPAAPLKKERIPGIFIDPLTKKTGIASAAVLGGFCSMQCTPLTPQEFRDHFKELISSDNPSFYVNYVHEKWKNSHPGQSSKR